MNPSRENLIEALYNEYVFLCHDDFEPGVDIEPEDYLTMLKDMTYDELVDETCTDDTYHLSEFMEAWGWLQLINLSLLVHSFGFFIGAHVLHHY